MQKRSYVRLVRVAKKLKVWCAISAAMFHIEIINNKVRHNLMDAKCRWRLDRLDDAVSFREPLGQTKVMQICQGETLNHLGAITHEVCCLAAQWL